MKKTQQQQIRRCELCYAHSGIIRNFTMRTERSCSFSISVPITILSRRHHKIKKLCSDILNMICSEVISSAFHTGKDRRRARKCAAAGEKKEKRRKVISSAFAVASLAPAQDGPGFPAQLLAHTDTAARQEKSGAGLYLLSELLRPTPCTWFVSAALDSCNAESSWLPPCRGTQS
ncbi:uncharacterized protein [Anas platyrhynchos]|uniref:uncharacterized protein isoform X2 n=1 Tax=Anas platyrhynchos TaxID=8839 RepID=UPI003AF2928A